MTTDLDERFKLLDKQIEVYKDLVLDAVEAFFKTANDNQRDAMRHAFGSVAFAKCEAYADFQKQFDAVINEMLKGE